MLIGKILKILGWWLLFLVLVGCEYDSYKSIVIDDAIIYEIIPGQNTTAAYITLRNNRNMSLVLTKVTIDFDISERVEIHGYRKDNYGSVKMFHSGSLEIPPGETIKMMSGAYHIMIFDTKRVLKLGEIIQIKLYFSDGTKEMVDAKVISR